MATPHTITRFSGLYTSINPISGRVPEGARKIADNVVIRSAAVLEPRRGYYASSPSIPASPGGGGGGGGVGTTFPSTIGCIPPFAVDIDTGAKPGSIYGPSDGSTPIVINYSGITVDPSLGMAGYPPAGTYYVVLGTLQGGLAWYDPTGAVAGGVSDGCSPGTWSMQCYGGSHLTGDPADPASWVCLPTV